MPISSLWLCRGRWMPSSGRRVQTITIAMMAVWALRRIKFWCGSLRPLRPLLKTLNDLPTSAPILRPANFRPAQVKRLSAAPIWRSSHRLRQPMGWGYSAVLRRLAVGVVFCAVSVVASFAQSPPGAAPLRGFVPPYEILRTVRAAGFEPLAPPLRERTSYVVRAIDFRGMPMRVVVDARSGAIRDANRIVSGAGLYGPYVPGPYPPVVYG